MPPSPHPAHAIYLWPDIIMLWNELEEKYKGTVTLQFTSINQQQYAGRCYITLRFTREEEVGTKISVAEAIRQYDRGQGDEMDDRVYTTMIALYNYVERLEAEKVTPSP